MAQAYFDQTATALRSHPALTGVAATAILSVAWTVNDFLAWKAFGTGGTPPTLAGYWKMTKIRIQHNLSGNDLLDPSPLSTSGPSYLKDPLPQRSGSRPQIIARTMPQRQKPEPITSETRSKLQALMRKIAGEHPELLEVKPSHTEGKSTDGLYCKEGVSTRNTLAKDRILGNEIAHAHPTENSLHVWLSEVDARKVMEAGWGMRFPLPFVAKGWSMVYAPRNEEELETVERIVRAGVGWVTGVAI